MRVKLLLKSAWLRPLEGWLAPAVFPETLSGCPSCREAGGAQRRRELGKSGSYKI